jgi:hypothetical protein
MVVFVVRERIIKVTAVVMPIAAAIIKPVKITLASLIHNSKATKVAKPATSQGKKLMVASVVMVKFASVLAALMLNVRVCQALNALTTAVQNF